MHRPVGPWDVLHNGVCSPFFWGLHPTPQQIQGICENGAWTALGRRLDRAIRQQAPRYQPRPKCKGR